MAALPRDLQMHVTPGASSIDVKLRGAITERAILDVSQIPGGKPVILDIGEVRLINSLGVRVWLAFINELCAKAPDVSIVRMTPMMALNATTISVFLARARLDSFMAPFECPKC